jgi:hypothetical protein
MLLTTRYARSKIANQALAVCDFERRNRGGLSKIFATWLQKFSRGHNEFRRGGVSQTFAWFTPYRKSGASPERFNRSHCAMRKTVGLSHKFGGDTGTRTLDPLLAKQVL